VPLSAEDSSFVRSASAAVRTAFAARLTRIVALDANLNSELAKVRLTRGSRRPYRARVDLYREILLRGTVPRRDAGTSMVLVGSSALEVLLMDAYIPFFASVSSLSNMMPPCDLAAV